MASHVQFCLSIKEIASKHKDVCTNSAPKVKLCIYENLVSNSKLVLFRKHKLMEIVNLKL